MFKFPAFFIRPAKPEKATGFRVVVNGHGKFFVEEASSGGYWYRSAITPTDGFVAIEHAEDAIKNLKDSRALAEKTVVKYYA